MNFYKSLFFKLVLLISIIMILNGCQMANINANQPAQEATFTDLLLEPSKYKGTKVTLKGRFFRNLISQRAFTVAQGHHEFRVEYDDNISLATRKIILDQKDSSGVPVVVTGVVVLCSNCPTFIVATHISF